MVMVFDLILFFYDYYFKQQRAISLMFFSFTVNQKPFANLDPQQPLIFDLKIFNFTSKNYCLLRSMYILAILLQHSVIFIEMEQQFKPNSNIINQLFLAYDDLQFHFVISNPLIYYCQMNLILQLIIEHVLFLFNFL